jgi:hypothetical protein
MRRKAMQSIVMAVVLAAVLVLTGLPQADAKQVAAASLKQLAALNAATVKLAADGSGNVLATAICILSSTNQNITKLGACGSDDILCKSGVLLDSLLDILVCINPDDPNLALYQCVSDAIVALAQIKSTCGDDQACVLGKVVPEVLNLVDCFGQESTAAAK